MSKHTKLKKVLTSVVSTAMLASSLTVTGAGVSSVSAASNHDYGKALELSLYFYDANKCGEEVTGGALTWRKNCHTYDSQITSGNTNLGGLYSQYQSVFDPDGDGYIDLSGGYHDAGDFVKFNLPASYAASTLAWGVYEFESAYAETGCLGHAQEILRYFADYLIKSTFLDSSGKAIAFCYQVGDGGSDHNVWRAPEVDTSSSMKRPAFFVTSSNKSSEQCYQAAAALSSIAVVLEDTDAAYASKCVKYAEALYKFGNDCGSSITYEGCGSFYASDTYKDDKAWSECWLYLATDNQTYLNSAKNCSEYDGWIHCWNKVMGGYYCMMYSITGESSWKSKIESNLSSLSSSNVTPQGYYAIGGGWGSARYNTAWQMYAAVYQKYSGSTSWLSKWQRQMDYLLGDNNLGMSYLIGYGDKYPTHPHHRGSGQNLSSDKDTSNQKYILWGALVGGPSADDSYNDVTNDYVKNEVAIDYNAACVGSLAGLYTYVGGTTDGADPIIKSASEINSSYDFGGSTVTPQVTTTTTTPKPVVTTTTTTKPVVKTTTTTPKPIVTTTTIKNPTTFETIQYDLDLSNRNGDNTLEIVLEGSAGYNTNGVVGYTDGSWKTISWSTQYDSNGDAKITVDVSAIPSNVTYAQLQIQWCSTWDNATSSNLIGTSEMVSYSIGNTTSTTNPPDDDVVYGDANLDGEVTINDVVAIMIHCSTPGGTLSAAARNNADVYQRGDDVSNMDALAVQKKIAQLIPSLPESVM